LLEVSQDADSRLYRSVVCAILCPVLYDLFPSLS
jgi:hypothetical protein